MKYSLPILPFLLISILTSTVSNAQEDGFSSEYCAGIYKGIRFILGEADKNWTALGKNLEGSPDYNEHAMKIQWTVEVAANYTIIHEAFCAGAE